MNESCYLPPWSKVQEVSSGLVRLNLATRQWHAAVDDSWLDLLRHTITIDDYVGQLVRTYGLVAPFESACKYTPGLARVVDISQLIRAGLIAQDLLALGLTPTHLSKVPTCSSITMFMTIGEALGWLYVIERTTLLADGLVRHIQEQIPQVASATMYLETFAKRSSDHWRAFGRIVDRAAADPAVARDMETAACTAFQTAQLWFSQPVDTRNSA